MMITINYMKKKKIIKKYDLEYHIKVLSNKINQEYNMIK